MVAEGWEERRGVREWGRSCWEELVVGRVDHVKAIVKGNHRGNKKTL